MTSGKRDFGVGIAFAALALLLLLFWIPEDVETGLIETHRRQVNIGDAMLPSAVGVAMLVVSAALLVSSWRKPAKPNPKSPPLHFRFIAALLAVVAASLLVMNFMGPLSAALTNLFTDSDFSYRQLRDTPPFKYLGFSFGGFLMVFGLISLVEHRLSWRRAGAALLAVAALIVVYDLPFDDLLLPPNGDY
ncbi:MAG: tripartite tricarboxylate transporter TctB family protein [SAR324 cluster bacterium]|nr:tripartite tricarboxylate transporter TctB family protein [SAR324 cluster bacterium]